MNRASSWLSGVGVGAGLMYLLDPERGRRRRARVRDKFVRAWHVTDDMVGATTRDIAHRTQGLAAESLSEVRERGLGMTVPDHILEERVRAKLGRVALRPSSVHVSASDGNVTLTGPVLAKEVPDILAAVRGVRGVKAVENLLDIHQDASNIPALQGGGPRPELTKPDILQSNWSPTTRMLVAGGGGLLSFAGLGKGGPVGLALTGIGSALVARGATNIEMKRLLGIGGGRRAVDFQKEINIKAPVHEVFEFWRHFENFPRYMGHVRDVRDLGEGRSHWTVTGPAGATVHWDAVITRMESNKILAWKTIGTPTVAHAGIVRFDANPDGSTRIGVRLSYNPPAGALGHAIAAIFGSDPKRALDEDLVRLKSLIEEGKASAPGKSATRDEVQSLSGADEMRPDKPSSPADISRQSGRAA
jgi:uncharacterized membrane protein